MIPAKTSGKLQHDTLVINKHGKMTLPAGTCFKLAAPLDESFTIKATAEGHPDVTLVNAVIKADASGYRGECYISPDELNIN